MYKILTFAFVLFCIAVITACSQSKSTTTKAVVKTKEAPFEINLSTENPPFKIDFQIEELKKEQYNLSVALELCNNCYIISPHSNDTFYLHFDIYLDDSDNIIVDNTLLEIPTAVEEIDAILNIPVKFVRGTAVYKQHLKVINKEDFEVSGLIEFLLEPSCVPYDVEFVLSYRSGVMKVKKIKTSISKEYKL
jgi:hypothetical protein